jgi:hypothetical protein
LRPREMTMPLIGEAIVDSSSRVLSAATLAIAVAASALAPLDDDGGPGDIGIGLKLRCFREVELGLRNRFAVDQELLAIEILGRAAQREFRALLFDLGFANSLGGGAGRGLRGLILMRDLGSVEACYDLADFDQIIPFNVDRGQEPLNFGGHDHLIHGAEKPRARDLTGQGPGLDGVLFNLRRPEIPLAKQTDSAEGGNAKKYGSNAHSLISNRPCLVRVAL